MKYNWVGKKISQIRRVKPGYLESGEYSNYLLEAEGVSKEVLVAVEAVSVNQFVERVCRIRKIKTHHCTLGGGEV